VVDFALRYCSRKRVTGLFLKADLNSGDLPKLPRRLGDFQQVACFSDIGV
jgi:hypothetical protein